MPCYTSLKIALRVSQVVIVTPFMANDCAKPSVALPLINWGFPDELAKLVERWERLPDAVRAGILAMVRAATPE